MSKLQKIINRLPNLYDVVVPPGVYTLKKPIILPKVDGQCRLRGYGVTVRGGNFPSFLRRDEGERDSCTGWTIGGFRFLSGQIAMNISQARQLRIERCSASTEKGFDISFGLLTQVVNCNFQTEDLGVRIGHGDIVNQSMSNCSVVKHSRFFGGGTQLLIDSCSSTVVDQCTFEGHGCDRSLFWDGHFSTVSRNINIRNCYWEVRPTVAAMSFERLHSGSIIIEQPEIHPAGQQDTEWTSILGRNNKPNARMVIRMPVVLSGMMDVYGTDGRDGIRSIYFTTPAGFKDPNRWVGGHVGAGFRDSYWN